MRYKNGREVLPENLLTEVQKYAQGVYLYIPKINGKKKKWGEETTIRKELNFRNREIYGKYLSGMSYEILSEKFHLSEKSVRRIILGEKREREKKLEHIMEIQREWDLQGEPVALHHFTWRIGEDVVLKEYKDRNELKRNLNFMRILRAHQMPVPEVIQTKTGAWFVERHEELYLLTKRLPGRSLVDPGQLDEAFFKKFGEILGTLHKALKACEETMSFWQNSLLEEMNGWIQEGIEKYKPSYINEVDFQNLRDRLEALYTTLPKQLIHRDVHLGNFLFHEGEFSGYIDFDLSQSNIRVFDLCYFLLGLLVKEDNHFVEEEKWFEAFSKVLEGYHEVNPIIKQEREALALVMKSIEVLFVVYFLSIGDEKRAQDAGNIFQFLERNTERIQELTLLGDC